MGHAHDAVTAKDMLMPPTNGITAVLKPVKVRPFIIIPHGTEFVSALGTASLS
jgi:hypothetical protein